jgi:hypothetical protein
MVTEESMEATLRASIEAFNRRDWEAARRLFDADIVYMTTYSACRGVAAVLERYRDLVDAVPDLRIDDPYIISIDRRDRCAVFGYTQTGTRQKDLRTPTGFVRGDGERFILRSIHVIGFTETGLIADLRANLYRGPT